LRAVRDDRLPVRLEYVPAAELPADGGVLGRVRFGVASASVDAEAMTVSIPLKQLDGDRMCEVWRSEHPVTRRSRDGICLATNGEVLFGALCVSDTRAIEERAREAYLQIVETVRSEGYPNLIRVWNHFPRLLEHESGLERYQAFCAGRSLGFELEGFKLDGDLPAASAVGSSGEGLVVVFLATKREVSSVENPRQLSAFRYPPRYGPRSPSFARATVVDWGRESQLYVSGTASIVGHESVHLGDPLAQLRETAENLRLVLASATCNRITTLLDAPNPLYRIYVRHERDFPAIREALTPVIGAAARRLVLRGDICRDELLLEIELVVRF
jgi:chorismate lyase/3-hydroxybenzoate synthase